MEYNSRNVKEGLWVHKTKEDSKCLEVTGCDYHRKTVSLVDGSTLSMDVLVKDYMIPTLEGLDLGRIEKEQLLGGLDKEGNQPRETATFKDDVEKVLDKAETVNEPRKIDVQEHHKPTLNLTSEQRMLSDAIGLSKGETTSIESNVKIEFDFDIKKIVQLAKMFKIDNDKVVDIILSSDGALDSLKAVLRGVINDIDS